jgi:hypothetical protein
VPAGRVELEVIAEVEAIGAAASEGWACTRDFVTAVSGGRKGEGRRRVTTAKAVTTDRTATRRSLASGSISRAQAEVVVDAVDRRDERAWERAAHLGRFLAMSEDGLGARPRRT